MSANDTDEIVTAYGLSPKAIDHEGLRELVTAGWLLVLDAQMVRLTTPLHALYDILLSIQDGRDEMSAAPLSPSRFRAFFQSAGRALTDDSEHVTQDAIAGTILTLLWKYLAHLAHHIGLNPRTLRYGEPINGVPLTQVLWAVRGAETHSMSWLMRDFKVDKQGLNQIAILKAAGITPIPFRGYEALQTIAPNGVGPLASSMIPIMHAMVECVLNAGEDNTKVTKPTGTRKAAARKRRMTTKQ
ncbi:MAG: hypothetical protein EPN48_18205 [Microbacteriaceae bacterium]|nr:MAG: hypothetical protein EPN48_18205 [Microbacteriaceae bacterium]